MKNKLLAAFVNKDITPPVGRTTQTGGREIVMVLPPEGRLQARIALFEQAELRCCIISTDLKLFTNDNADYLRRSISQKTNIPFDHILLSASHTHTAPDVNHQDCDELTKKIIEAITEAGDRLSPADRWVSGSVMTHAWGICQRPVYRMPNGDLQVGTQGSREIDSFSGLDGEDETELRALELRGVETDSLGGVVNYTCHPVTRYGSKFYSPDFPGVLLESLDRHYSSSFLFANGCSGNVAPSGSGEEFCKQMGANLAAKVPIALSTGETLQADTLRVASRRLNMNLRIPTEEQVRFAHEFLSQPSDPNKANDFSRKMYGNAYHFKNNSESISRALCQQIIDQSESFEQGLKTEPATLQVIAVGEVAFIGFSAEIFNQFRRRLQARSPFKVNIIFSLANGWNGYVAPPESMKLGGYECSLGLISRLTLDAGETMLNTAIELLEDVKGTP